MSSSSSVPSAAASQTVCSEEITNQTLMNVIMDLRAQLTSMSRRQDELIELVVDLRRELMTRAEPTVCAPSTITQPSPGPASSVVPREAASEATDSAPPSSQGVESATKRRTSAPSRPIAVPERRIRRQNAFYHISNAAEAPWKAPGGYRPHHDGAHPTQDRPAPERPASLRSPVLHLRTPDSRGEGNRLPPPYPPLPLVLVAQQGTQSSSLPAPPVPQANGTPALPPPEATATRPTLPVQPTPTPRARPLHREGTFYHVSWFSGTPFVAPGPGIFQPPPNPPTTAPATAAAPIPSPKRKRKDSGNPTDDDEASHKKRSRRPSNDDVD